MGGEREVRSVGLRVVGGLDEDGRVIGAGTLRRDRVHDRARALMVAEAYLIPHGSRRSPPHVRGDTRQAAMAGASSSAVRASTSNQHRRGSGYACRTPLALALRLLHWKARRVVWRRRVGRCVARGLLAGRRSHATRRSRRHGRPVAVRASGVLRGVTGALLNPCSSGPVMRRRPARTRPYTHPRRSSAACHWSWSGDGGGAATVPFDSDAAPTC